MIADLRAPDVLHRDVGHDLRHRAERLVAGLLGLGLVRLDPEAGDLLLDPGPAPHVAEEGAVRGDRGGHGAVSPGVARVHVVHHVRAPRPGHPGLVQTLGGSQVATLTDKNHNESGQVSVAR